MSQFCLFYGKQKGYCDTVALGSIFDLHSQNMHFGERIKQLNFINSKEIPLRMPVINSLLLEGNTFLVPFKEPFYINRF